MHCRNQADRGLLPRMISVGDRSSLHGSATDGILRDPSSAVTRTVDVSMVTATSQTNSKSPPVWIWLQEENILGSQDTDSLSEIKTISAREEDSRAPSGNAGLVHRHSTVRACQQIQELHQISIVDSTQEQCEQRLSTETGGVDLDHAGFRRAQRRAQRARSRPSLIRQPTITLASGDPSLR